MIDGSGKYTKSQVAAVVVGIVLVAFGVWGLCEAVVPQWIWGTLGNLFHAVWSVLWPLALIAAGICLLWGAKAGKFAGFAHGGASRPLRRSRADRRLLGVCGGIAYYFSVDSTVMRVMVVILLVLFPPSVIVAYILLAILIPQE